MPGETCADNGGGMPRKTSSHEINISNHKGLFLEKKISHFITRTEHAKESEAC